MRASLIICLFIYQVVNALDFRDNRLKNQEVNGRIIGGEAAAYGEFPWQVSIRHVLGLGLSHFCGGTIIDKDWVLTAAQCCQNQVPLTMHAIAGVIKLFEYEEEEQMMNTAKIIMHPDYDPETKRNDICLLHMAWPFEFNDWVQPIGLPIQGQETEAGTECMVTGWGSQTGAGGLAKSLQKAMIPVVSDEDCNENYASGANMTSPIAEHMICAGLPEVGDGPCSTDMGGPLTCGDEVIGIISWGGGHYCDTPPFVFTQISFFADWIYQTICPGCQPT